MSENASLPQPDPWDIQGDNVPIEESYGPLDAKFTGEWREDGTFSGAGVRTSEPTRP